MSDEATTTFYIAETPFWVDLGILAAGVAVVALVLWRLWKRSPMTPAPKRRWLRFSLRTLFVVVTVVACWLAYAIPWIKARREFLAPPVFGEFNDTPPTTLNRWGNSWPVYAPGGLWLLGERGLVSVWLPPKFWSLERQAEAARLFPEAVIFKTDSKGRWVSPREPGYSDTSREFRSGSTTNPISD